MHCPFCGAQWVVPALKCPACDSTRSGDAKYYYTAKESELRIDFCKSCKHYVKVVKVEQAGDRLHVGLELLTTSHLDAIAQDKNLRPLDVCS
jgi:formate dehydrogenase maturation protein FdhE